MGASAFKIGGFLFFSLVSSRTLLRLKYLLVSQGVEDRKQTPRFKLIRDPPAVSSQGSGVQSCMTHHVRPSLRVPDRVTFLA